MASNATANAPGVRLLIPWAGLATALAWAISPIFIRAGLAEVPSPLLGVAIGLTTNVFIYGLLLWLRRDTWRGQSIPRQALLWQIGAAAFVALATWARWIALDTVPVATVSAIERLSIPVVILLSLFMLDQKHERVNWRLWLGGLLIVGGALILTLTG
jgi:uncharacterized membrane protein